MNPMVSVIVPSYGGEDSLIRAVDSVLNQTYQEIEIIVVDDNNPETDARKRTEKYMQKYTGNSKVKYIKHEKNKNGSAARNTGFKNSSGNYICLLDDDDSFREDKVTKQVEFLESNKQFGGCYCWRTQNGKDICSNAEGDLSESLLDLSFTPTTSALMLRRECFEKLKGFDETYRRHQDFEFLLRFYKLYKIGVVKEVLLDFIGNGINNQPSGKKFFEIKKHFFAQFSSDIERINNQKKGFRERVYAEHFARAYKDLLRHGHFILATKLFFTYGYKGGILFWKIFFKCCLGGVKERLGVK